MEHTGKLETETEENITRWISISTYIAGNCIARNVLQFAVSKLGTDLTLRMGTCSTENIRLLSIMYTRVVNRNAKE